MWAEKKPLAGKHYGTQIDLRLPEYDGIIPLGVWVPRGGPSFEQLAEWGVTLEQWQNNLPIDDGWGGEAPCRDVVGPFDSHYQSKVEADVADLIVDAINGSML